METKQACRTSYLILSFLLIVMAYMLSFGMPENIVIDTSVLISALIGKEGPGREVLRQCLQGLHKPLISNALFQECEDVSARDNILELCPLSKDEVRALLNAYYATCRWVSIYYLWRPNLRDENDNFLIELAVAGNSQCIVTNNTKDLRAAELNFKGLKILTPEQFLRGD